MNAKERLEKHLETLPFSTFLDMVHLAIGDELNKTILEYYVKRVEPLMNKMELIDG